MPIAVPARPTDPYRNFQYVVVWRNAQVAGFSSVEGLKKTLETAEYREGGDPTRKRKQPMQTTIPDITFKKGLSKDEKFIGWLDAGANSEADEDGFREEDLKIQLLDKRRNPVFQWKLKKSFCKEVGYENLDANASDVLMTSAVIACEDIEIEAIS